MKKFIKITKFGLCALSVLTIAFASCENRPDDSKENADQTNEQKFDKPMEKDAEFVTKAADGGMMEVMLGELAKTNASSQQVKEFAAMMVTDHSKANEELKSIAAQKNITVPSALSSENQEKYNDLSKKTGEEFDKDYASFMVKDHKDDIELFKHEAESGNDAELKNWASGKVPTLEHHLHMAEEADSTLKK